ncbi:hypothetical protein JCM10213_002672 [Rhodosporidiobolus nylandii]
MSTSPVTSPPPASSSRQPRSYASSSASSRSRSRSHSPIHTRTASPLSPPPASPTSPAGFLVRALHSFSPSTLSTGADGDGGQQANSCLSFEAGDVIRCLNQDESGWWDGELLDSPGGALGGRVRGWFPRNYVEVLDEADELPPSPPPAVPVLSPEAHTLLSSIEQNVGLLENAVRAGRKGHYQPSTACVISSIRTVLSSTSALTRDSPVLRAHPPLSSARKKILSSLASLVNQARKASAPSLPLPPDQADDGSLSAAEAREAQDMLDIAYSTIDCVSGFLEEAEKRGVEVNLGLGAAPQSVAGVGLLPSSGASGGERDLRGAKSTGNLREQRRPTLEALQMPVVGAGAFPVKPQAPPVPSRNASAATIKPIPAASYTPPSTTPSNSIPTNLASAGTFLVLRSPAALSSHLTTLHDSLLSTIAAVIGHVHSHSRSSSPASSFAQLIDLTREGIERVRDCLLVVEKVAAEVVRREEAHGRDGTKGEEMKVLAGARERLYEATTALVGAARVATSAADAAGKGKAEARERDEEERKVLLSAATGVLRAGGDCVGAVKLVVSQLASDGGELELTLPRPKTSEELAAEAARDGSADGEAGDEQERHGAAEDASDEGHLSAGSAGAGGKFSDAVSGEEDDEEPKRATSPPRRPRHLHTLSMLGRKATSLGNLRGRFEQDLKLEEAEEDEDDAESRGSTATAEAAASSPPPHATEQQKKPERAGHRVKTSSISLSPAHARGALTSSNRAPSPSPTSAHSLQYPPPVPSSRSTSPVAERSAHPTSFAMSRAYSSGSGHSHRSARSGQSSSRATAVSTTSTIASSATAQTAETSPRNSYASTKRSTRPSSGGARTSFGSAWEKDARSPPLPLQVPTTPTLPLPLSSPTLSGKAGTSAALHPPRAQTPDRDRAGSPIPAVPASPSGRERGNVPWFLEREYLPREVSFTADGHVSGGTLRCLVERMTLHDTTIDAAFSNTFLLTFRMFTTPLGLAQLLFTRFDLPPPVDPETGAPLSVDEAKQWTASKLTPIRLRIYNLFKTWVEGYWLHEPDKEIVEPLLSWGRGRLRSAMPAASQRLVDLVSKRVLAAERDAAAAKERSSLDDSPSNASATSLNSTNSAPVTSMSNGSSLSLALSPSRTRDGSAFAGGGLLHRMQSTDKLKAGKPVVPFSSAALGGVSDSYSPSSSASVNAPPPIVTKALLNALRTSSPTTSTFSRHAPSVVDIDPLELARQLTIMESRVYCAIRPDELLGSSGVSASGAGKSEGKNASVRKMSALSTRLTGWIAETILGEQDQKRRTALVKYFVKLGDRLLALSNYNALFAVFTALNSSTIARLRKTWDALAPKYKAILEVLRKATDHSRNYAEYRQKIRQAVPPCLPFVGLFLTDLIFIFEGNRAERPSPVDPSLRLINFDRYHKMARIISELQRFQVPYQLVEVPEIQGYLAHQLEGLKNGQDAQSLYRQSLLIEPRQPSAPSSSAASTHSADSRHHRHDVFNWRG